MAQGQTQREEKGKSELLVTLSQDFDPVALTQQMVSAPEYRQAHNRQMALACMKLPLEGMSLADHSRLAAWLRAERPLD